MQEGAGLVQVAVWVVPQALYHFYLNNCHNSPRLRGVRGVSVFGLAPLYPSASEGREEILMKHYLLEMVLEKLRNNTLIWYGAITVPFFIALSF